MDEFSIGPIKMPLKKSIPVLRMLAFMLDWLVLAMWGGTVFGIVMISSGGNPPGIGNPWQGQAVSFAVMTLPFILYFALTEASSRRASLGKRIFKLEVVGQSGETLAFGTCLIRNGIKFVPWELGHMVANHAALTESDIPIWIWAPMTLACLGCLWWLTALFFSTETPYNRWGGAQVVRSRSSPASLPPNNSAQINL